MNGSNIAGGNPTNGRVNDDFYATNPADTIAFLELIDSEYDLTHANILEPSAGQGHITNVLKERYPGSSIVGRDLVDRGNSDIEPNVDFLKDTRKENFDYVITNPPFNIAREFIDTALTKSDKVFMFAKLQFLEGRARKEWFQTVPLKYVYVYSYRANPWRNGESRDQNGKRWASTMAFAWYVLDKDYVGEPIIKWI